MSLELVREGQTASDSRIKLGIISVAIGEMYADYWQALAKSVDEHWSAFLDVKMFVLTDQPRLLSQADLGLERISYEAFPVESFGWPEATLLRFELMEQYGNVIGGEFVLYLDADMRVHSLPDQKLFADTKEYGAVMVQHPGYYRPRRLHQLLAFYASSPWRVIADLRKILVEGGLGEWETRPRSSAFTPRKLRKEYLCGGAWIATRESMLRLVSKLAIEIRNDSENGIIARWHDESHLNALHAREPFRTVPPRYCFSNKIGNLRGIVAIIEAVEKGERRIR